MSGNPYSLDYDPNKPPPTGRYDYDRSLYHVWNWLEGKPDVSFKPMTFAQLLLFAKYTYETKINEGAKKMQLSSRLFEAVTKFEGDIEKSLAELRVYVPTTEGGECKLDISTFRDTPEAIAKKEALLAKDHSEVRSKRTKNGWVPHKKKSNSNKAKPQKPVHTKELSQKPSVPPVPTGWIEAVKRKKKKRGKVETHAVS